MQTITSLPYANIILLSKNKGVISNEVGHFQLTSLIALKQTQYVFLI